MRSIQIVRCEEWRPGHYGPSQMVQVSHRRRTYRLDTGHGTRDWVYVWRSPGGVFHSLTHNYGLGYIGAAWFDTEHHLSHARDVTAPVAPFASVFLQMDHEIHSVFGRHDPMSHWTPITVYKRLEPYLEV